MANLFDRIREAVEDEHYLVGAHALVRMDERGIPEWQIIAGTTEGRLLAERPDDLPFPSIELMITLPDGTPAKAVWSWIEQLQSAKLVTVHYFDRQ